jgi:hypothetical protein
MDKMARLSQCSGSGSALGIRIQIQEGYNDQQNHLKNLEISCFGVLDGSFPFSSEGVSCSLDVLYVGLGII